LQQQQQQQQQQQPQQLLFNLLNRLKKRLSEVFITIQTLAAAESDSLTPW
jgi:hypothetical protein